MAFVPVPKDLNRVKTKVMFNLTKRQLICFFHRCGSRRSDLLSGEGASRLVYGGNADGGHHAPVYLLRSL